jgi:hypothetical protein
MGKKNKKYDDDAVFDLKKIKEIGESIEQFVEESDRLFIHDGAYASTVKEAKKEIKKMTKDLKKGKNIEKYIDMDKYLELYGDK